MEWYVSSLAIGGGSGLSEVSPWTLTEAETAYNNSTVSPGDRINIKADGIYLSAGIVLTRSASALGIISWEAYSESIGDLGRVTIRRSGGTGVLWNASTAEYCNIKGFIFDGQNSGTVNAFFDRWCIVSNCDSINAGTVAFYGEYRVLYKNCFCKDSGTYGFFAGKFNDCIAENCGGIAFTTGGGSAIRCIARNSFGRAFILGNGDLADQCIVDGGTDHGVALGNSILTNTIITNLQEESKFAILYAGELVPGYVSYNNLYNNLNNESYPGLSSNSQNINPNFTDADTLDYTRADSELDGAGMSDLGYRGTDYSIDIGIGRVLTDYPIEDNVRNAVSYNNGVNIGNVTLPTENKVLVDEQYGSNGTEYTGTLSAVDQEVVYPIEVTIEEDGEVGVTVEVD